MFYFSLPLWAVAAEEEILFRLPILIHHQALKVCRERLPERVMVVLERKLLSNNLRSRPTKNRPVII